MPVIHVRALAPAGGEPQIDRTLRAIAADVAGVLEAEPSGTWCTFTSIDRMTIGTDVVTSQGRIVYVDVWIRSRGPATDGAVLSAACRAAAGGLEVPVEDAWGTLRAVEPGAVFAGGSLIDEG
jgi:hypothetical protein